MLAVSSNSKLGKEYLSPSRINTFFNCPRNYYYHYVLGLQSKPSIHLYRGSLVHQLIDDLFALKDCSSPNKFLKAELKKRWNPSAEGIVLSVDDNKKFYKDTEQMLNLFARRVADKVKAVLLSGKAHSKIHAWNFAKPRLSEHHLINEEHKVHGIIDSVEKDFDDRVFIVDYKTSTLYKNVVNEDYVRQLRIYSLLYLKEFGRLPTYAAIHYLRYGEIYLFAVTQDMIDKAVEDISFVRKYTQSTQMSDYPKCDKAFCDHHYFEDEGIKI